ncbi:COR domain-containing protein [Aliivibrio wodanis]|uniref:COR domain-containing protein n=1 Tax=Aliivibrio wodanis TaxID=80852 RepID=UPI00406CA5AB
MLMNLKHMVLKLINWKVKWQDFDVNMNFWDFGGQEIMHATHQFFLSKRSLYILVLDGRKEEKTEYWLKHIDSFGGESPILIVINKIDDNPSFDINRRFLQEKYKNIIGFYRVSCAKNQGFSELQQGLIESLSKVQVLGMQWPTSWFNVKSYLENISDHYISYDKYNKICLKNKLEDEEVNETLLDFLHDLGVVLHFKDFGLLDTHVLEPEWVTQAVYRIINSKLLSDNKGLLKLSDLNEILKANPNDKFSYPKSKHKYIVELMLKFQLCYQVTSGSLLVPDLLEVQEPEINFDFSSALSFVVSYDFLPKSIISRLQVALSKDIFDRKQWRTGMLIKDDAIGATAIIKSDNRESKIYIWINGAARREYLAVIRHLIKTINYSFSKLKHTEQIPLPDNQDVLISYDHLRKLEDMGKKTYFPDGANKEYKVSSLLGNIYINNENEEMLLEVLKKLKSDNDSQETLAKKANDIIQLQPNFFGIGVNVNALISKVFPNS